MKLEDVEKNIAEWIENFLQVDNPDLNGWSPCPFAGNARLKKSYNVRLGTELYSDLMDLSRTKLGEHEVVIYAYPREFYTAEEFHSLVDSVNQGFLVPLDLIALDDHPDHPESVNGVSFNNGQYALALVQSLSDLNQRAASLAKKGFYDHWPEEYLEDLFRHRQDPRHDLRQD